MLAGAQPLRRGDLTEVRLGYEQVGPIAALGVTCMHHPQSPKCSSGFRRFLGVRFIVKLSALGEEKHVIWYNCPRHYARLSWPRTGPQKPAHLDDDVHAINEK